MEASTVVDEQQDTRVKPVRKTYFSHNRSYIIPRVKPVERTLQNGKMVVENKADYDRFMITFEDGFFYATPGTLVAPNPDTGEEEDVVTFLENHPRFGQEFFLQEQQAPDPTEAISEMAEYLAANDLEGLAGLYERERSNWARPQVLEPIRAAKAKLEALAKQEE